jgi:hypothetical protein
MKKDDGRAMTGVQIMLTDSVRMNGMMADLHDGLPCAVCREKDLTIEFHRTCCYLVRACATIVAVTRPCLPPNCSRT